MIEFLQLLLLILAVVLSFAGVHFREDSRLARWLREAALMRLSVIIAAALAAFLGCLAVAGVLHEPVPRIHDEFSYLLMSDTLAHGRASNPAPPLPEFFDTFHVLVHPVYASKYFPAQGLFLAIGEKLTGHPAVGVWLSSALACAAICWMLQAWIGPVWGLFGAILMVLQYGIFSYWSQSYWGGMVAALGGALFFGAARRLWERISWPNAIWLALGAVILVNSRPLEGILAALPVSGMFAWKIWTEGLWRRSIFWRCLVIPAGAVLLLGAAATCSYNRAITGSPWKSPYMLHEEQYQESPPFLFMSPRPKITYTSETLRRYYEVREFNDWNEQRVAANFVRAIARKLATWWAFYCGVLLTGPLVVPGMLRRGSIRYWQIGSLAGLLSLAALSTPTSIPVRSMIDVLVPAQIALLWFVFDDFWERLALVTCALMILELFVSKWSFPHYFGPAASLVLSLQVAGLRRMWHWHPEKDAVASAASRAERRRAAARANVPGRSLVSPWRGFVALLPVICAISLVLRVEGRINGWSEDIHGPSRDALLMRDWSLHRADLEQWLEQQAGPQLVFVRYHPRHNVYYEWVWNRADLVHAKVIWARDLGAEHNRLLLQQFPDRTVWSVEADRLVAQLTPYSETTEPASPTTAPVQPQPDPNGERLDW